MKLASLTVLKKSAISRVNSIVFLAAAFALKSKLLAKRICHSITIIANLVETIITKTRTMVNDGLKTSFVMSLYYNGKNAATMS